MYLASRNNEMKAALNIIGERNENVIVNIKRIMKMANVGISCNVSMSAANISKMSAMCENVGEMKCQWQLTKAIQYHEKR
jgi:hypothetical protein